MLYINGEWTPSVTNKSFTVYNPATKEKVGEMAYGNREDTEMAISSAEQAFKIWKRKTAGERSSFLKTFADQLRVRAGDIAKTITLEMGKSLRESIGEVNLAISYVDWYSEEAKRIYGDTIPASSIDKRIFVFQEPVGVTAAITPWNFPAAMITRKIAPALAAGCTVIVKPASATPLTAKLIFEALDAARLPKGVANLVTGPSQEIAATFNDSFAVRKLTFTGSTEVGIELMRGAADTVKKVAMELGGHAPYIVFEDADLETAVDGAIASKFRNAGQTCVCTNRIYVHESIADEFGTLFAKKVSELVIGNGLNDNTDIGPLINRESLSKVTSQIDDAIKHGGKVIAGGKEVKFEQMEGCFFEPTVINYATDEMIISKEETFGPVAPIFTFQSEEEVVERANHFQYGLAAYCYTNDFSRAIRMMENLEYGIVGINDEMPTTAQAPFGGVKASGVGREGGKYGLQEYLVEKYVSMKIKQN
ncbi:NAD-dependent succinate-semialdehyde dehydrogenase [Neobacillus niacini]|uniref:NAD-dependent succinate-semialdehyde dehydrogenase n=1 Tax=Neobacillus niacini TaxID=86668 RepID=UPI0021CB55FC|nr:NAD-dependent succinate-semialdehyde dehydrogenase [Neobacillus niacini]MCM3767757.1 NAD-dependent succinate-semialdehyde dehydrogenase [Neobacillus niacini]